MKRATDDSAPDDDDGLLTKAAANAIFQRVLRDAVVRSADLDAAKECFRRLLKNRPNDPELQYRIGVVMMHLRIHPSLRFEVPRTGTGPVKLSYYGIGRDVYKEVKRRQDVRQRGIVWIEKAAAQNHADAAFRAGMYRNDHETKMRYLNMAAAQNHQQAIDLLSQVRLRMSPLDHVCWAVRGNTPMDPEVCATLVRSIMIRAIGATRILRARGGPLHGIMHDETYAQHIVTPLCAVQHETCGVYKMLPAWLIRRACNMALSPVVLQLASLVGGMSKAAYEQLLLKEDEVHEVVQWVRR